MPTLRSKPQTRPKPPRPYSHSVNNVLPPSASKLERTGQTLGLIWRRNRNQFRTQRYWWVWFSALRRGVELLVRLEREIDGLQQTGSALRGSGSGKAKAKEGKMKDKKGASGSAPGPGAAEQMRMKLEKERELRSRIDASKHWLRETVVPGAYVAFSRVVKDVQFTHLGIVLMACLADLANVVGYPMPLVEELGTKKIEIGGWSDSRQGTPVSMTGLSMIVTGEDTGKVVRRLYSKDCEGEFSEMSEGDDMGEVVPRYTALRTPDSKGPNTHPSFKSTQGYHTIGDAAEDRKDSNEDQNLTDELRLGAVEDNHMNESVSREEATPQNYRSIPPPASKMTSTLRSAQLHSVNLTTDTKTRIKSPIKHPLAPSSTPLLPEQQQRNRPRASTTSQTVEQREDDEPRQKAKEQSKEDEQDTRPRDNREKHIGAYEERSKPTSKPVLRAKAKPKTKTKRNAIDDIFSGF